MLRNVIVVILLLMLAGLIGACSNAQPTQSPVTSPTSRPQAPASASPGTASTAVTAASPTAVQATATAAPTKGGTLRPVVRCDTAAVDPHGPSINCMTPAWIIYNTLVGFDKDVRPVPELAESWDLSKDGKTIIFKLRKGVKFQDGTDFNAAAVKFNIDRLGQPTARYRNVLDDVEKIDVVDDYTIQFSMKQPSAPLLLDLASEGGMIVSPEAVKKYGKDYPLHPVGTGPYKMGEHIQDDHFNLDKFDGYWEKDKPYFDRLAFKIIPDATVRVANLRTSNVDWIDEILPKDMAGLEASKDLKTYKKTGTGWWKLTFNTTKPPFDNMALRQAVNLAIDREAIVRSLFFNTSQAANGPLSPSSWAYDSSVPAPRRDPAKAKAKLAEGGKPEGFEFTLTTFNYGDFGAVAEAVQAQLADIGIKMKIEAVASAQAVDSLAKGNFQAAINQNLGTLDPQGSTFLEYHSKSGSNRSKYANPKVDSLLEQARATYDTGERKKLYSQAIQIINDESPMLALFYIPVLVASNNKLQNYVNPPGWYFEYRMLRDTWMTK